MTSLSLRRPTVCLHTGKNLSSRRLATKAIGGNGLFTSTTPELRRIIPPAVDSRPVIKIVYVVLEAQYQSSLTTAVQQLNGNRTDFNVEMVGYLVEELRDADNFETFKKDVANANIFIGSLIFIEDLAEKVHEVVSEQRERMDAILVFPSMPKVMRLNKLGSFSMSQLGQSKSAIGSFMKKQRENNQVRKNKAENAAHGRRRPISGFAMSRDAVEKRDRWSDVGVC